MSIDTSDPTPVLTGEILDSVPSYGLSAALEKLATTLGVTFGPGDFTLAQLIELPPTETIQAKMDRLAQIKADALAGKKVVSQPLRAEIRATEFRLRQCQRRDAAQAARTALGPDYADCWCLGASGRLPSPIPVVQDGKIVIPTDPDVTVMTYMRTCSCPDGVQAAEAAAIAHADLQDWIAARDIERILGTSGIPARYRGLTLDTWVGRALENGAEEHEVDAIELAVEEWFSLASDPPTGEYPHVLLLAGGYGTGKTGIAIHLGSRFANQRKSVVFRTVSDFYAELRAAPWRSRPEDTVPTEIQLIQACSSAGVLILDDWGGEAITDASEQKLIEALNSVLDSRLREMRPTILTTNLKGSVLTQRVGDRLMQRVKPDAVSTKIVFKTPDLRDV
jgi:DNA replication protein DnaC